MVQGALVARQLPRAVRALGGPMRRQRRPGLPKPAAPAVLLPTSGVSTRVNSCSPAVKIDVPTNGQLYSTQLFTAAAASSTIHKNQILQGGAGMARASLDYVLGCITSVHKRNGPQTAAFRRGGLDSMSQIEFTLNIRYPSAHRVSLDVLWLCELNRGAGVSTCALWLHVHHA